MSEILKNRPWSEFYRTKGNRLVNISLRWLESNEVERARLTTLEDGEEKIIAELEGPFPNEVSALKMAKEHAEAWCEAQQ